MYCQVSNHTMMAKETLKYVTNWRPEWPYLRTDWQDYTHFVENAKCIMIMLTVKFCGNACICCRREVENVLVKYKPESSLLLTDLPENKNLWRAWCTYFLISFFRICATDGRNLEVYDRPGPKKNKLATKTREIKPRYWEPPGHYLCTPEQRRPG